MPGSAHLGLVDWGIGGLGLLGLLDAAVPELPVTYWSDTGWRPYGLEGTAALSARLVAIVAALADEGCTEVVLACNAASTVVDRLDGAALPVQGIIAHGVAAAAGVALEADADAEADADGPCVIGVVGGRRTIASGAYRRGLAGPRREVRSRVAQPLSAHIEAGRTGTTAFTADLARIVAPLRGAEVVVLACTHYPAAGSAFAAALPGTALVDPAAHLAQALADRHGSGSPRGAAGSGPRPPAGRRFLTTGDQIAMRRAAHRAWSRSLPAIERAPLDPG